MVDQTYRLLLKISPDFNYLAFVFFATICSYNFHWLLTSHSVNPSQRLQWAQHHKGYHLILYLLGGAGAVFFFFYLSKHWSWLLLAAVITFLYSAPKIPLRSFSKLKRIAIGKTIFLSLVWTYVTTILPLIISGYEWRTDFILFIISRFFFIYAICILFDYRDREDDKAEGIRSLITFFSEKGITVLFIFSLLIFGLMTIWLLQYSYSLTDVIIILIPGIILAFLFNYSKNNFSDYFYYILLDGLMMFSSLIMLLLSI
jgi:4-hydroxybenzoate polyprenyltransferase